MPDQPPDDPATDPFRPPDIPTEVFCLHCQQEYDSYLIEWREEKQADGSVHGFWCCPTPGCGGMGFGFDLLPTDPEYRDERGGWCDDEEDDGDEEYGAGADGEEQALTDDSTEWLPPPPDAGLHPRDRPKNAPGSPEDDDIPW